MSKNLEPLKDELENFSKIATIEIKEDTLKLTGINLINNQLSPLNLKKMAKTMSRIQVIESFEKLEKFTKQDKYTPESRKWLEDAIKAAQSLLSPGSKPTKRGKDDVIRLVKNAHDSLKEVTWPTLYQKNKCCLDLMSNIKNDYKKAETTSKTNQDLSNWQIVFEEDRIILWNMSFHNGEKGNFLLQQVYKKIVCYLTHDQGVKINILN